MGFPGPAGASLFNEYFLNFIHVPLGQMFRVSLRGEQTSNPLSSSKLIKKAPNLGGFFGVFCCALNKNGRWNQGHRYFLLLTIL